LDLRGPTSNGKRKVQRRGEARVGKGKKRGKGKEGTGWWRKKRRGGKRRGKEREREGDTRHTYLSLLPAPLLRFHPLSGNSFNKRGNEYFSTFELTLSY